MCTPHFFPIQGLKRKIRPFQRALKIFAQEQFMETFFWGTWGCTDFRKTKNIASRTWVPQIFYYGQIMNDVTLNVWYMYISFYNTPVFKMYEPTTFPLIFGGVLFSVIRCRIRKLSHSSYSCDNMRRYENTSETYKKWLKKTKTIIVSHTSLSNNLIFHNQS